MKPDTLTSQHLGKDVIVQGRKITFTAELAEYDNQKRRAVVYYGKTAATVPYERLMLIPDKKPAK